MSSGFSIRIARPGDAAEIAAIYAPIVLNTAISFEVEPPSAEELSGRIAGVLKDYPWLVCEDNGSLLGSAYASQHRARAAYRWSVDVSAYVAQTARGKGVGRALYAALIQILKAQHFRSAFAGIALPNAASIALHEGAGFKPLGVYKDVGYKLGAWRDVGWWQLALNEGNGPPEQPVPFSVIVASDPVHKALQGV